MPMADENKVRQPANLGLISPPTRFSELLLQEVRMSMQYLTSFSRFSFSLLFLSSLVLSLFSFLSFRYRQVQTKSHTTHYAKQKLLSVCSKRQIRAVLRSVPLLTVLSQKALRSTKSPVSCIILKAFIPTPSSFCSSSTKVSYLHSHLITLRASISSLQRVISLELGWYALRVLMAAEMRRKYLSIFMVLRKWFLSVLSAVLQTSSALVRKRCSLANGRKSTP